MALTDAQTLTTFEILEVPYDTSALEPMGRFNLTGLERQVDTEAQQLQTLIITKLSSLSTAQETRLIEYINLWDAVGVNTTSIDGGSIGGASGVSIDWDMQLRRIQQRVKILVPVMRYKAELDNDKYNTGSASVPVLT